MVGYFWLVLKGLGAKRSVSHDLKAGDFLKDFSAPRAGGPRFFLMLHLAENFDITFRHYIDFDSRTMAD